MSFVRVRCNRSPLTLEKDREGGREFWKRNEDNSRRCTLNLLEKLIDEISDRTQKLTIGNF